MAKLGPKAYEQCAGFMRITGWKESVGCNQRTSGKSYEAAKELLEKTGIYSKKTLQERKPVVGLSKKIKDYKKLAEELGDWRDLHCAIL